MNYSDKLKDPRWQQMRLRVFDRDGWCCRSCGAKKKTLHAHHAAYHPYADGPWDYDEQTIITLCVDCHAYEHAHLKAAQANIMMALAKAGLWSTIQLDQAVDILGAVDFGRSSPDEVVTKGQP